MVSIVFRRKVRGAYREVRRLLATLNSSLAEDLSGIKVIQVFRRESARRELYREINDELLPGQHATSSSSSGSSAR